MNECMKYKYTFRVDTMPLVLIVREDDYDAAIMKAVNLCRKLYSDNKALSLEVVEEI